MNKKLLLTVLDILLPVVLYLLATQLPWSTWPILWLIFFIILAYNLLRKKFYGYYAFDHPEQDDTYPPISK